VASKLTKADSQKQTRTALDGKAARCAGALKEAQQLVAARSYGPLLKQTLARTYDLFDEIDEILLGLHPAQDHEAFVRVAGLHRQFEEIQSLIPRTERAK
jgi:hypothetical protein